MTARSKKRRNKNTAIRRVKNKVKEVKKLKRTLGLIDEDGKDLMEKIKDITEQQKKQEELDKVKAEAIEDIYKHETKATVDHNTYIEVVNEKTKVKHVFNEKTKRDQFGCFPVWYNAKKEQRKQKRREGKTTNRRQFRGRRVHNINKSCAWKNAV